jgi:serine/threonine protein kinase
MEYCGAGSLCDLMAICERTLSEEQIQSVMKMSLQGLKYLHENRKIHRGLLLIINILQYRCHHLI